MMSSRALYEKLSPSVVKVVVASRAPRAFQPWDFKFQEGSGASACVVEGQRLLTCAHVVAHAVHIHVLKPGDARMYKASVVALDHDRELALLAVEDPGFFEGTVAVSLGELPYQQDLITVWGYPTGAATLSITSGIVSRIEVIEASYSRRPMLAMQTDAVVTFGNSGGPVFLDDKMVGLVLQGSGGDESKKTYIVPSTVISCFFEDLADGTITGVPDLGVYWQKVENGALKASLGLPDAEDGVLVVMVVPDSSAWGVVQADDVITSIDDEPLGGDGTVPFRDRERVDFGAIIGSRQIGDTLSIVVWRKGSKLRLEVVLRPYTALIRPSRPGSIARYYVFGGLVFQPLTHEYIEVWQDRIDSRLLGHAKYGVPTADRSEIVVLSQVLAHDVNMGYHDVSMLVVVRVNGTVIRHLGDLPGAFEKPMSGFHIIDVEGLGRREVGGPQEFGGRLVLDAARVQASHAEILSRHGMSSDRSLELVPP